MRFQREVLVQKIRIYYDFFNNVSNSIGITDKNIKNKIENIIRKMHKKIIHSILMDDKDPLLDNFKNENELRDFLFDPSELAFKLIKNCLSENLNKIVNTTQYKELLSTINEFIDNYNNRINDFKNRINKENEESLQNYKNIVESNYKKDINDKINDIKYDIKDYNMIFNEIKNKYNNSHLYSNIFDINKNIVEKMADIKNKFQKNRFTKFNNENELIITKFYYKSDYKLGKLLMVINNKEYKDLNLEDELYFNEIKDEDISIIKYSEDPSPKEYTTSRKNIYKSFIHLTFNKLKDIEDEKLKLMLEKENIMEDPSKNSPIVIFNSLSSKQFINELSKMKNHLEKFKKFLLKINENIGLQQFEQLKNGFEIIYEKIIKNSSASLGNDLCKNIINSYQVIDTNLKNANKKKESFVKVYDEYKDIIKSLKDIKSNNDIFTKSFNIIKPEIPNKIENFTFNEKGLKDVDLSIPFISFDEINKKLEFCYNDKLEKTIGPICPNLYNDFLRIRILNSIKDRKIITEIRQKPNESDKNIFNELIEDNNNVNVEIKKEIPKNTSIIIRLRIPALKTSKEETHLYNFDLLLKTEKFNNEQEYELVINCKFFIKLIPISVLLISEKYNLKLLDKKNFKLCADKLYSGEEIKFKLSNFINNEIKDISIYLDSLKDNMVETKPIVNIKNKNEIILKIKNTKEKSYTNELKKLNCVLIIILAEDFIINIIVNAYIIPINFTLSLYDYTQRKFLECDSIIYYNQDLINKAEYEYKMNLFLKIEINDIDNDNLEGNLSVVNNNEFIKIDDESKKINLKTQILKYEITFFKNRYSHKFNYFYLTFKLKYKNIQSEAITCFKKAYLFNSQDGHKISNNFDIYYFNNKEFIKLEKAKNYDISINYTLIYPFDIHTYEEYIIIDKVDNNKFKLSVKNINTDNMKYLTINSSNGEIDEENVNNFNNIIWNNKRIWGGSLYKPILLIYKRNEQNYIIPLIVDLNDEIFKNWKKTKELTIINKNLQIINNEEYKNKTLGNSLLEFSSIAYLIINSEETLDNFYYYFKKYMSQNFYDIFKDIYFKIKNKEGDQTVNLYNMILLVYNYFIFLKKNFGQKLFYKKKPDDKLIQETYNKSIKEYFFYNENLQEKLLLNNKNNNINLLNQKIKQIKNNYDNIKNQKIFLIESNCEPKIKQNQERDIIKENIYISDNNLNSLKNSQNEPPLFKSPLLEHIKLPENILEIIDLYNNFISDSRILPLHLIKEINYEPISEDKKMIKKKKMKDLANRFTTLLSYFQNLKIETDYSILSNVLSEFSDSMHDLLSKFKAGNTSFEHLIKNNIQIKTKNISSFVIYPEKIKIKRDEKKWEWDYGNNHINNLMNKEFQERLRLEKKRNFKPLNQNENENNMNNLYNNYENENSINNYNERYDIQQNKLNIKKININEIEKKYVVKKNLKKLEDINLVQKSEKKVKAIIRSSDDINDEREVENPRQIENRLNDDLSHFNEKKALEDCLEKIEKLDITKEKMQQDESAKEFPITKNLLTKNHDNYEFLDEILNISESISSKIIIEASKRIITKKIPFENIEVNFIVDCSRYLSEEAKYFNMIILCGIAVALNCLKIKYSLGLMGDGDFKIEIKKINEPHDKEHLQKILDCVFIPRCVTDCFSCIKHVKEKFESRDRINVERVFFILSNGIDKNLKYIKEWANEIFNNDKHSFGFLFIESNKITQKSKNYLIKEVWEPFYKPKNINYISKVELMHYNMNLDLNFYKEIENFVVNCLVRKNIDSKKDYGIIDGVPLFDFPQNENYFSEELLKEKIDFIKSYIEHDDTFKNCREPYSKKIEQNCSTDNKGYEINSKVYLENQEIILSNSYGSDKIYDIIYNFTKEFKEKKENLSLSSLDLIFKPNKPTQLVLSSKGSIIDINELIKYFINPTPTPMFYRELNGGFIKNYGITLVIDNSISCLNILCAEHTIQTIRIFLSSLSCSDLPCFDLIITGEKNPIVICSELNVSVALDEKSEVWTTLYSLLIPPKIKTDLASAIKVAYEINCLRKIDCINYIFVITDGLFSQLEQKNIKEKIMICENKGINVFGLGVGISPRGIENLFNQIVFSQNPYNLFSSISTFFGDTSYPYNEMPYIINEQIKTINLDKNKLIEIRKNPIFLILKEELKSKILTRLNSLPFYIQEKEEDVDKSLTKEEEVIYKPMYTKDILKTQKVLIVMCWSKELSKIEHESVCKEYVLNIYKDSKSCIKKELDYFGIETVVVDNYIDAIKELTEPDKDHDEKCKYYATWVMNGPSYAILPNNNIEGAYYIGQFLEVLKLFWMNGGAVILLAENDPFTYQTNLFLDMIDFPGKYKKANFRIGGNYKGGGVMIGVNTGELKPGTFNKKINTCEQYQRPTIGHHLSEINEGITVAFTDYNIENIKPFIPFSRNSNGGVNAMFYIGEEGRGDIVIDCSYTKFLSDMKNVGTAKYIQNIGAWSARIEYHYTQEYLQPSEYRPKLIEYNFNKNNKWTKFSEKPKGNINLKKLKTLIAFDQSGSVLNKNIYFERLKKIIKTFYNQERGDAIYKWQSSKKKLSYEETMDIINGMIGSGGTSSHLIAEIANIEKNNNFRHLVIVTDGEVSLNEIKLGDKLMKDYQIKFDYVTTYVIHTSGKCDKSVGASYCRNCPNITIYIDKNNIERPQASLTQEDLEAFEKLNEIKTENEFYLYFNNIKNAVKAKTLGAASKEVQIALTQFHSQIENPSQNFINKWNELYNYSVKGNTDMELSVC